MSRASTQCDKTCQARLAGAKCPTWPRNCTGQSLLLARHQRVRGNSHEVVNPPAGRFRSRIVPPCCEITWRAMVRPSPVPPVPRLRDVSRRRNGSKTTCMSASGIPGPSSSIRTSMQPAGRRASTRAALPYFTAFSIRFEKARFSVTGLHTSRPAKGRRRRVCARIGGRVAQCLDHRHDRSGARGSLSSSPRR